MNPSLKDQLREWNKKNPMPAPKKNAHQQKPKKRESERLSEEDIKDLMGMNMPVMKRGRGGAWRNGR